jgi:hypothetical protein
MPPKRKSKYVTKNGKGKRSVAKAMAVFDDTSDDDSDVENTPPRKERPTPRAPTKSKRRITLSMLGTLTPATNAKRAKVTPTPMNRKRKATKSDPGFTVGKRGKKERDLDSDESMKELETCMRHHIVSGLQFKLKYKAIHEPCMKEYPSVYGYAGEYSGYCRKYFQRIFAAYESHGGTSVGRAIVNGGTGGHNAITIDPWVRDILKAEGLMDGGSTRNISRALKDNHKITIGKDRRLSDQMMRDRLTFAINWLRLFMRGNVDTWLAKRQTLSNLLYQKIRHWLFTDEKTFFTYGSHSKRPAKWVEIGSYNRQPLVLDGDVWSWMEMKLNQMAPIYKREELMVVVQRLWKEYSLKWMDKMCRSYENMLWALIESKGGYFVGRGTKFSGKTRSPTYNGGSA